MDRKEFLKHACVLGVCGCPLVDARRTPSFLRHCSVSYQKEAFETVVGRPSQFRLRSRPCVRGR